MIHLGLRHQAPTSASQGTTVFEDATSSCSRCCSVSRSPSWPVGSGARAPRQSYQVDNQCNGYPTLYDGPIVSLLADWGSRINLIFNNSHALLAGRKRGVYPSQGRPLRRQAWPQLTKCRMGKTLPTQEVTKRQNSESGI